MATIKKDDSLKLSGAEGNVRVSAVIARKSQFSSRDLSSPPSRIEYAILAEKIAAYYAVGAGNIVLGNGSDELIENIARFSRGTAITVTPCFERLFEANLKSENNVIEYALKAENDYNYTEEDHAGLLGVVRSEKPASLWLCSPNNPTGTIINLVQIAELAQNMPQGMIVVDEVFIDFIGGATFKSAVGLLANNDNIIVLNSFSKTWGLPSIRLGFAVTSPRIVQVLTSMKILFNINAIAFRMAHSCIDNDTYRAREILRIHENRAHIIQGLKSLDSLKVISNSEINLVCIRLIGRVDLYDLLLENNIKTKSLNFAKGMFGSGYCRILVPRSKKETSRLIVILRDIAILN